MLRRILPSALVATMVMLGAAPAWAGIYDRIEKPWSLTSLLEVVVITICGVALSRTKKAGWAVLALVITGGWAVIRVWLDPMFDLLIGVMMRNGEISLATRIVYQLVLFTLTIIPVGACLVTSARAGHFEGHAWRRAVAPVYVIVVAVLIISPEFMVLDPFEF